MAIELVNVDVGGVEGRQNPGVGDGGVVDAIGGADQVVVVGLGRGDRRIDGGMDGLVGVVELHRRGVDGDRIDGDRVGLAREGDDDGLAGIVARRARIDRQPVIAADRDGIVGVALQLGEEIVDLGLQLAAVDVRRGSADQLLLDLLQGVLDGAEAGGDRVDGRLADAEGVLDGAEGTVVGADGGGDRPVGGVVGGGVDAQAGGNVLVGLIELGIDVPQGLQGDHGGGVCEKA